MPSYNSYVYYKRFLRCLRRNLEKQVEDRRKKKYIDKPEILVYGDWDGDNPKPLGADDIYTVFKHIFDELIKKAPSAQMGGDGWLDKFFNSADKDLCSGMWCHNERCESNNGGYPYYCSSGGLPSKCKAWKAWRMQWRSYPEKEVCQKCRYFKPIEKIVYITQKQYEEICSYKCYCRAKKLPEGCPKKKEEMT
jgi:hypothetical protein